jgi:DNA-binding MarR family transcriptional regulator
MISAPNMDQKHKKEDALEGLYVRPGFLLRRANQIAAAAFLDAVSEYGLTTTQFGALTALSARGPMDQASLARLLYLDRSTAGLVIANLEQRGAISRAEDSRDRRRRRLTMTRQGEKLLKDVAAAAECVPAQELAIFTKAEAREFMRLLKKFVGEHSLRLDELQNVEANGETEPRLRSASDRAT